MNTSVVGLAEMIRDATDVSPVDPGRAGLAAALTRLLDIEAIRNLVALYSRTVDDGEVDRVVDMFAEDGAFVRLGVRTHGRVALGAMWRASRERYAYTRHTTCGHVVVPDGDTTAYGWAQGQAELSLGEQTLLAAYRYDDRYVKQDGRWLFGERALSFSYVLPADDLSAMLGEHDRIRWPGQPASPGEHP